MVRPGSCGPLELQPITYKGETAHEAGGITIGRGPQPFPSLSSPECPTSGLPKGGKPAENLESSSNSDSIPGCRKVKRISESKLRGIVRCNLVSLLTRGGARPRVVGPSIRVVHGEQESRRSLKQDPSSTACDAIGTGTCCPSLCRGLPWRRRQPSRLYKEGQPAGGGQQRIVDQAKAQGNAWDTGVVPGHLSGWSRIPRADEVKVK
jgi:hypothetical protein